MRGRAFTLIELMIVIALMAIMFAIPLGSINRMRAFGREAAQQSALRQADQALEELAEAPYDRLPPRQVVVPPNGLIQLPPFLTEASVRGHPGATVDLDSGRIRVPPSLAGRRVIIDYAYNLVQAGEAHSVPQRPPYTVLLNERPVRGVQGVRQARGEHLAPVTDWKLLPDGRLSLPARLAGGVVEVSYCGGRTPLRVSGQMLRSDLTPGEGPFKLIRVEQDDKLPGAVRLTCLRGLR